MSNTTQKVAIVTGASRGIGAEVAQRLAQDGFAVVVNYASNASEAEALVTKLRTGKHTVIAIQADVSNTGDVQRLFEQTENTLGKVDVLVNNAGIMKTMPIADTTDEVFDQTFAINARGTFNMLRAAAKRLNDGGRVINFSSTTVALNLPGYGAYIATKAAVESFTKVFANEMRGRNITVNAVAPGPIATALFLNGKTGEQIQRFSKAPPLERLGQPSDIAGVVSFLAGPDGAWVNGQVLRVNGGLA